MNPNGFCAVKRKARTLLLFVAGRRREREGEGMDQLAALLLLVNCRWRRRPRPSQPQKAMGAEKGGENARHMQMWHTHTHTHTHSVSCVSYPKTGQGDAPIKCRLSASVYVCVCVCSVKRLTAKAIRFPPGAKSNVEKLMHRACLQLNLNKMLSLLSITRQMPAASYPFLLHSLLSFSVLPPSPRQLLKVA